MLSAMRIKKPVDTPNPVDTRHTWRFASHGSPGG